MNPVKSSLHSTIEKLSEEEARQVLEYAQSLRKKDKEAENEAELLAQIKENSHLPSAEQGRFNSLRRKRGDEILTETEEEELQRFWGRVEKMNVARLEALTKLARRPGTDVRTLMHKLGLSEKLDVF